MDEHTRRRLEQAHGIPVRVVKPRGHRTGKLKPGGMAHSPSRDTGGKPSSATAAEPAGSEGYGLFRWSKL